MRVAQTEDRTLVCSRNAISLTWIRGHRAHAMADYVDRFADALQDAVAVLRLG